MTRLDYYLTDNSAAEDADYAYECALDALGEAITECGDDPIALAELLRDVIGEKNAAEVIRDYLQGDSTLLCERVVDWAGVGA
jgi:hypothetical protein